MATWDDVRRIALALPETAEQSGREGTLQWLVGGKSFAWERPLRRRDLAELGDDAPEGPVLAASVPDLGAKEALLAADPRVYLTTSHFDGFCAILVQLERIGLDDLQELLTEAWLARAPRSLTRAYLAPR